MFEKKKEMDLQTPQTVYHFNFQNPDYGSSNQSIPNHPYCHSNPNSLLEPNPKPESLPPAYVVVEQGPVGLEALTKIYNDKYKDTVESFEKERIAIQRQYENDMKSLEDRQAQAVRAFDLDMVARLQRENIQTPRLNWLEWLQRLI